MNHRQMLLIWLVSMRERRVLRIDILIGYPASAPGHVLEMSRGIPLGEIGRASFRRGVPLRPPAKIKKADITTTTEGRKTYRKTIKKPKLDRTKPLYRNVHVQSGKVSYVCGGINRPPHNITLLTFGNFG